MYLIGGNYLSSYGVSKNDVHLFDFNQKTLKEVPTTGTKPSPRYGHASVLIKDTIYLYGGYNSDKYDYYNDFFSFNTITQ